MALVAIAQSSLTLTASEQSAGGAVTTGKTVVLQADLINMAAGDVVEINCYVKTAGTGGTARMLFNQIFVDPQTGSPVFQSIPVPGMYSVEFKIVQPTGTGKVVDYCLMALD